MNLSNKKDVSVEYAHIYTNDKIGVDQCLSLEFLGRTKEDLTSKNKTFSLVVMVDDYSFPDPTFNYEEFLSWLKKEGFAPDIVFRESQLIPLCDEVLQNLKDEKLKGSLLDYIQTHKYPCSLFIAAWYLLRLGYLHHAGFYEGFCAKSLINILPESFKPFEDKGLEIIAATPFAEAVERIEYSFIKGRLIA